MASSPSYKLPGWVSTWLAISSIITVYDAGFVLLRPHTFPGGKYHDFWKLYGLYVEVDRRYLSMTDTFLVAVTVMNLFEVAMNVEALWLNMKNSRQTSAVAFTVSVMTMWKTVLYLLQYLECVGGGEFHATNSQIDLLLMLWLPSAAYIVVPLMVIYTLWSRFLPDQASDKKGTRKSRTLTCRHKDRGDIAL